MKILDSIASENLETNRYNKQIKKNYRRYLEEENAANFSEFGYIESMKEDRGSMEGIILTSFRPRDKFSIRVFLQRKFRGEEVCKIVDFSEQEDSNWDREIYSPTTETSIIEMIMKEQLINNSREIAYMVIKNNEALEILLMLADLGQIELNELKKEIKQENQFMEIITEFHSLGLIIIKEDELSISSLGKVIVKKLREMCSRNIRGDGEI